MPITLLDVILIGVMLISAVLAMIRGFMREILSIAAWVLAAVATLYSYGKLLPYAKSYVNNDIVATGAVVAGTFLLTLLVVSVVTVRFSDMVPDDPEGIMKRFKKPLPEDTDPDAPPGQRGALGNSTSAPI